MLYETFRPQKPKDLVWSIQKQDEFRKLVFSPQHAPPRMLLMHGRCGTGKTSGVEVMLRHGYRNDEGDEESATTTILTTSDSAAVRTSARKRAQPPSTQKQKPLTQHQQLMNSLVKRYFDVTLVDCVEHSIDEVTDRIRDHATKSVSFVRQQQIQPGLVPTSTTTTATTNQSTTNPISVVPVIPVLILKNPPACGERSLAGSPLSLLTFRDTLIRSLSVSSSCPGISGSSGNSSQDVCFNSDSKKLLNSQQNQPVVILNFTPMTILLLTDHDSHSTKFDLMQRVPSALLGGGNGIGGTGLASSSSSSSSATSRTFHLPPVSPIALKKRVVHILCERLKMPIRKSLPAFSNPQQQQQQLSYIDDDILTHLCENAEGDIRHCLLQVEWYILPMRFFLKTGSKNMNTNNNNNNSSSQQPQRTQLTQLTQQQQVTQPQKQTDLPTPLAMTPKKTTTLLFGEDDDDDDDNETNGSTMRRTIINKKPSSRIRARDQESLKSPNQNKINNNNNKKSKTADQKEIVIDLLDHSSGDDGDDGNDLDEHKNDNNNNSNSNNTAIDRKQSDQNAKRCVDLDAIEDSSSESSDASTIVYDDQDDDDHREDDSVRVVDAGPRTPSNSAAAAATTMSKTGSTSSSSSKKNIISRSASKQTENYFSSSSSPSLWALNDAIDSETENENDKFLDTAVGLNLFHRFRKEQQQRRTEDDDDDDDGSIQGSTIDANASDNNQHNLRQPQFLLTNVRDELASAAHTTSRLLTNKRSAEYAMTRCNVDPAKLLSSYIFENVHLFFGDEQQQRDDDNNNNNNTNDNNTTNMSNKDSFNLNENNNNNSNSNSNITNRPGGIIGLSKVIANLAAADRTMNQEFTAALTSANATIDVSRVTSSSSASSQQQRRVGGAASGSNRLGSSSSFSSTGERCLILFQRQYKLLSSRIPRGQLLCMNPSPFISTPNEWRDGLPPPPLHSNRFFAAVAGGFGFDHHHNSNNINIDQFQLQSQLGAVHKFAAGSSSSSNSSSSGYGGFSKNNDLMRLSGLAALVYALQENTSGFLLEKPSSYTSVILDTVPLASLILLENRTLATLVNSVNPPARPLPVLPLPSHGMITSCSTFSSDVPGYQQHQQHQSSSSSSSFSPTTTNATVTNNANTAATFVVVPKPKKTLFIDKLRQDAARAEAEQKRKEKAREALEKASNNLMLTKQALNIFLLEYPRKFVAKRILQLSQQQPTTNGSGLTNRIITNAREALNLTSSEQNRLKCDEAIQLIASDNNNNNNNNNSNSNNSGLSMYKNQAGTLPYAASSSPSTTSPNNSIFLQNETRDLQLQRMKNLRMGVVGVAVTVLDPISDD